MLTDGQGPADDADLARLFDANGAVADAVTLGYRTLLEVDEGHLSPTLTVGWAGRFLDVVSSVQSSWELALPPGWLRVAVARCSGPRVGVGRAQPNVAKRAILSPERSVLARSALALLSQVVREGRLTPTPGSVALYIVHLQREVLGLSPLRGYLGVPRNGGELERMLSAYASVWGEHVVSFVSLA